MLDILIDTIIDNLKIFPFLFITYLALEYIENKTAGKTLNLISKAGKAGPFIGAICGAVPQCGFSVVASNLFSARIISLGALIAIYLSTSDEMLPIMISQSVSPFLITKIIGYKILCGLCFGFFIDLIYNRLKHQEDETVDIETLCQNEHCHCETSIFKSALHHSIHITLFIFIISLILNLIMNYFGDHIQNSNLLQIPLVGELICGLIGLIPNCSSSVIITQLYLENIIPVGTMMSGLLVSGGVGILVLFRVNRHIKENLKIISLLYCFGIIGGFLSNFLPF